jgi:hypothetical protein
MFFVSSGNIAAEYPDLREVVIGLDRHLAAVGDSAILSDTVADFVLAEPALVDRLLKEYVRQGRVDNAACVHMPRVRPVARAYPARTGIVVRCLRPHTIAAREGSPRLYRLPCASRCKS